MTARAVSLPSPPPTNLRRFDVRRDLLAVADLVEQCFAETLDADGRLYIEQMRRTARSNLVTKLASSSPNGTLPLGGYVWVEQGRLVGNLSLIQYRSSRHPIFLIANVAVHPQFRRRGIARALTQAALEEVGRAGRTQVWLQVDERNPAAIELYRGMRFQEVVRRTSWRVRPRRRADEGASSNVVVSKARQVHWPQQRSWLTASYPASVRWNLPFYKGLLDPGWRGAVQRLFSDRLVHQWAAMRDQQLLAILSWQSSTLSADRLWLAAPTDPDPLAIQALAQQAFAKLDPERELALNLPAGMANEALQANMFNARRTLIWMQFSK